MEKRKTIAALIAVTILGSLVCFYGTNLVLSDVSNMFYMTVTKDVISSLPIFLAALQFVLGAVALIRLYRYPQFFKKQARLYAVIMGAFALTGIVMTILTGTIIYGSMTVRYPFKGAVIISLIWHVLILAASIMALVRIKALPGDEQLRKQSAAHIIYTVFLSVVLFYSFNRLGAVLCMPAFLYTRNFDKTFWFYLSLLLPLAVLVHACIHIFGLDEKHPKLSLSYILCVIGADIALGAVVAVMGMRDTLFVSSVSPVVAIERLITMPIDTIVHFSLVMILALYSLFLTIKHKKKN